MDTPEGVFALVPKPKDLGEEVCPVGICGVRTFGSKPDSRIWHL